MPSSSCYPYRVLSDSTRMLGPESRSTLLLPATLGFRQGKRAVDHYIIQATKIDIKPENAIIFRKQQNRERRRTTALLSVMTMLPSI